MLSQMQEYQSVTEDQQDSFDNLEFAPPRGASISVKPKCKCIDSRAFVVWFRSIGRKWKLVPAALLHALPHYHVLCSGRVHQLPSKPLISIIVYRAPGHSHPAFKPCCALLASHVRTLERTFCTRLEILCAARSCESAA